MSNIYEQADAIMKLTCDYMEEEHQFDILINKTNLSDKDRDAVDDLFMRNAWWGMYKQRLLYILSDGVVGCNE